MKSSGPGDACDRWGRSRASTEGGRADWRQPPSREEHEQLEARRVELGSVVTAAVESVIVAAQAKNISVNVKLDGPAFINGDPQPRVGRTDL